MAAGIGVSSTGIKLRERLLNEGLKETVEIGTGQRPNQDYRLQWVTWQDLQDANLIKLLSGAGPIVPGEVVRPSDPTPPDLTVPPAPINFSVTGGFSHVFLEWTDPLTQYSNHAYTKVYRNTVDNFATAGVIAQVAIGFLYADLDVDHTQTYFYWISFVSTSDVEGPPNSSVGTSGTVATDPAYLLEILSNQITETQLFSSLNTRIDLIDTPSTGLIDRVTVVETDTASLASSLTVLTSTVGSNTAAIAVEALAVDGLEAQYSVKIDVNGNMAGFGLSVTQPDFDGGIAHSNFIVSVDTFAIASPGATSLSLVVDSGVVVMDAAFIKDATITNSKIQNLSVDSAKIVDASIITAKIADLAVTTAKIFDLSVTSAKISDLAVTSAKIDDLAVTSAKIGSLAVTNLKIGDNAVTIPVAAVTLGSVSITSNITYTNLQSISFTALDNSPVYFIASFLAAQGSGAINVEVAIDVTIGSTTTTYNASPNGVRVAENTELAITIPYTVTTASIGDTVTVLLKARSDPGTSVTLVASNRIIYSVAYRK